MASNSSPEPALSPGVATVNLSQSSAPNSAAPKGDQMLKISVASYEMLLPIEYLVEILTIPIGEVVPIFHLPPWVPGVYNWRGDILWTADLNHLLGLQPWYQQANYGSSHTVVVLDRPESRQLRSEERSPLGLIVDSVMDMTSIDLGALSAIASRSPNALATDGRSSTIAQAGRFVQGYWTSAPDIDQPVLNGSAILDAMPQPNS